MGREARDEVGPQARIERPALDELLDAATRHRICVVIAAAGWGKTTAVASWARERRTAWLRCDDRQATGRQFLASLFEALRPHVPESAVEPSMPESGGEELVGSGVAAACHWLRASLRADLVLVLDDLQGLPPESTPARVVEELCRQAPEQLHLVLVSRQELPFSLQRLRGQGSVLEVHAPELAFNVAEVTALLRATVGEDPAGLPTRVWECTDGWPAAIHHAVEALRGVDPDQRLGVVAHLTHPGERFHGYLVEEVIGSEPEPVREFLRRLSVFDEVGSTTEIAPGVDDPASLLADLTRRGLVRRSSGDNVRWSLVRPLAEYFKQDSVLPASDRVRLHLTAAQECMGREAHAEALRHLVAAGDHETCRSLLLDHGGALVNSGQVDAVVAAAELSPGCLDDPRIQRVLGQARQVRGEWRAATECFQRAGHGEDELEPTLAWRVGLLAYHQGEFPEVLALSGRARLAREDSADETRVLALAASTHRMVGDLDSARAVTARASAAAQRCGEPRAQAAVHQVMAMLAAAESDRRQADAHCGVALAGAAAGNDLLQAVWIRLCRAFHILDMGGPRPALAEAQDLLRLSERCGSPFLTAHALTTRGRANVRLGSLEPARADLATAIDLFQRLRSRFLAWPLCGLGDLHRMRGQVVRARAAYEEALAVAEPCHDVLALGSALVGLARVRAADDLAAAREFADRAVALGEGLREVPAFLARGWVALLDGDRQVAVTDAARAGAAARLRRDNPGLAEAIALAALASADPAADPTLLGEAITILQETGCRLEEAAVRLVAAHVGATIPDLRADGALETLHECGVDMRWRRVAGPLAVLVRSAPTVSIRALGVFQVVRDGTPVPRNAWPSKKARDLLKILVARRRPVPREQLMELLWPEADPARSGNRLSVLLSMVRDVLQPGQSEGGPLASDGSAVWLDLTKVAVDVEEFLTQAESALAAHRRGHHDATSRLTAAVAAHTADFLEDDPYQEWAAPRAEEIRATHTALLQALASRLRDVGDVDGVVRYTLRLLEQDPYDEPAHLDLVGVLLDAGRLGEARRRYRIYARRMKEIAVRPSPPPWTRHPR